MRSDQLVCRACFAPYSLDASAGVELAFPTGVLTVSTGRPLVLGREADSVAARLLEPYGNLSRRHASVRVDADGRAWIRDEGSMNGTFVEERRIVSGEWVPLAVGDRLRLAADLWVLVRGVEGDDA
ncbi:FHA domain-containing protein [Streptomyces scabiei]|uniref:FHA domain-containing protein n=1 Tax=Streptomyces scabiei TaxID=1930 RepID=UPI0033CFAFF9